MRISDWSSDVCSSDLVAIALTACFDRRIIFCKVSLSPDPAVNPALDLFELLSCPVVANPMFFGKCVEFHHRLDVGRSEEHTSELQSLMRISYAVFCLKKKNIKLVLSIEYVISENILTIHP